MDEYNQGWDPEVKRYLKKVMSSFVIGALWLLLVSTLGLAFRLAIVHDGVRWYNLLFYGIFGVSLLLLLFYYYRSWRNLK